MITTTTTDTYEPGRPIMTAAELRDHHDGDYGRDYRFSDDGYGDMEVEGKRGWKALAGWGRDGWDLGNWPYVSFLVRKVKDPAHDSSGCDPICVLAGETGSDFCPSVYQLLQIVEGDRSVWTFATKEDLYAAIDYLFLWYAAEEEWSPLTYETRGQLDEGTLEIPLKFRGPYRAA